MRIWLVTVGEPLPIDGDNVRLHRSGILVKALLERGHEVVWWTSTFDHFRKVNRFTEDTTVTVEDKLRLRLLYAPAYAKNVSLKRVWNHFLLGRKFKALARSEAPPDIILSSLPTLELCVEAVKYGNRMGVPVVLDIRDMWPDIFLDSIPGWAHGFGRLALLPLFAMARYACAGAFAIAAHAPAFVDWGLCNGNRQRSPNDKDFPFGYVTPHLTEEDLHKATQFWKDHGVVQQPGVPIICFFGTIGYQFDLDTVIQAARQIQKQYSVQFVLCGKGDRLDHYREQAADCENIVFPGWVNVPEIQTLMHMASWGLAPYVSKPNFEDGLTNKPIEYLSGGLPILYSLQRGIMYDTLTEHDCGVCYGNDSQKLESILRECCDSPERMKELSHNASQLFEPRFTAAKVYGEMADYLQEIASDYRTAGPDTRGVPSTQTPITERGPMRVWLVTVGEPLPIDEGNVRLHRSGILANKLVERGHEVVWWTSTFDHFRRINRFTEDTTVVVEDKLRLQLLHAPAYAKNLSLKRMWNHYLLGREFKALAKTEAPPDVIVSSYPTLELCSEAVKYGNRMGVPVVLDVRDMWPDIFLQAVPSCAQRLGRLALWPMFAMARSTCAGAFAITGHAPAFVDWALRKGGRQCSQYDRYFPFGYVAYELGEEAARRAVQYWKDHGVVERPEAHIVCFFGAIGHQADLDTVIQVARNLRDKKEIQFVICGRGDRLDHFRSEAKDCKNIVFPGWVNVPEIQMLMRMSSWGLAPFVDTSNYRNGIPNKPIEYLSGGLPILWSLQRGIMRDILTEHNCGVCYGGDAQKLENTLREHCDSPERMKQLSHNASQLFESRFTAAKVYEEMVDYLQKIASDYKTAGPGARRAPRR